VALPELDANRGVIAIQRLTLQNEGWRRDPDVVEPVTETLFDRSLAPVAATAVLELAVQTRDAGGTVITRISAAYEHEQQQLAAVAPSTSLAALELTGVH
jgi:hypothetical protein